MKEKTINLTKKIILSFFKDAKIDESKDVIKISNVPKEIEDFIGEKAPYKLVFDHVIHNKIDNSELIANGSHFLLAIRDYMKNKGQTTILKMNVPTKKINLKNHPKLKNYKIDNIVEREEISFLTQFTFLSKCQYINKREQFVNTVLIKDGEFLDISLPQLQKGNTNFISSIDITNDYETAKIKISDIINKSTIGIKKILKEKLEREVSRIRDYYSSQKKEKDEEVERVEEKINLLESKLKHTYYERDIHILNRLIRESEEQLERLKKVGYAERLKKEEIFHIDDELNKHVLLIDHELMNCTIIYYPVLAYSIKLVKPNGKANDSIEFVYDSLFDKLSEKNLK